MNLPPFALERYFAQHEFTVRYLLSSSDCDGLRQADLLAMADAETAHLWENLTLGYTEALGHPLLRAEIARLYRGITADEVLVIVPEEGIFLALNAILRPGDHVICTFPGYQSLYAVAEGLGCAVTRWQPDAEQGWRFDPALLEQQVRPNTRLLIVNFPHNPTGYLPPVEEYLHILDFARRHDLYLLSDEMYRFLELDAATRLPSACTEYAKAVTLFGMSKTYGLAGARIGWLVTQDQALYARIAALKDYTTICSSAPSEILALIALRNGPRIIANHLARIRRNLALLDAFFAEFAGRCTWTRPRAGSIAFPQLTGGQDSAAFCARVIREANVLLLPSTVYDYGNRHFRLGYGRENMPEALARLSEHLRKA